MTYEIDAETVSRHVDLLLVRTTLVCLHCFTPRDCIARPRIEPGVCDHCGYVGWTRLSDLLRDPNYVTKEHTYATTH